MPALKSNGADQSSMLFFTLVTIIIPGENIPRDTLSSHGSELKTASLLSNAFSFGRRKEDIPQKPVSNPTAKQVLSWLKAIVRAIGPVDSSIVGLVFMTPVERLSGW